MSTPTPKTMSSKHNTQPVSYYVISVEDMPGFVASLIQEYKDAQQVTPIESKQEQRDLMTVGEVCDLLHVVPATLNNWHRAKYLKKIKVGRRVLYHRADVEELAAKTNKH